MEVVRVRPAVALMAAKELADLTCAAPGPVATRAFLDRAIHCAKEAAATFCVGRQRDPRGHARVATSLYRKRSAQGDRGSAAD